MISFCFFINHIMKLSPINKISFALPVTLLITSILIYPLYLISFYPSFGYAYFKIFSLSSLSLLALSFAFFSYKKVKLIITYSSDLSLTIFLFLTISIIQFYIFNSYQLEDFGFSIIWVTIPLLVLVNHKTFKKILPYYLLLLWLIDLAHTFFQNSEKVGIAGNRNWHAIFSIALIIFSTYLIKKIITYNLFPQKKINIYIKTLLLSIFSVLWIYSLYTIHLCRSRGAILSLILLFILLILIFIKSKLPKQNSNYVKLYSFSNRKRITYFLLVIFMFLIITVGLFYKFNLFSSFGKTQAFEQKISLHTNTTYKEIEEAFNEDVRIPLWMGTLNLIINNPLLGVGATRFETAFAPYRPISYFLKPNTATRTNHPHNIILYILACYGLPGFVFWAILFIYPMIYCFIKFNNLDLIEKLSFFAYFCLFIHGCLDLILYVWPTLLIALLFLGILWNATWKLKEDTKVINSKEIEVNNALRILFYTTGFIIFIACFYRVYNETVGSYNIRSGYYYESQNKNNIAINYYKKGLKHTKPNRFIYKAALIALNDLQNPTLALKYFSYYNFLSTNNYAHNNAFIALCLMQKGNFKAALPYLYREVINFPISTGAWYRIHYTQNVLGMKKLANYSYKNMFTTLKYKDLPNSALNLILSNPDYDKHPYKIPKENLEPLLKK
jgi:O-antigen ligase